MASFGLESLPFFTFFARHRMGIPQGSQPSLEMFVQPVRCAGRCSGTPPLLSPCLSGGTLGKSQHHPEFRSLFCEVGTVSCFRITGSLRPWMKGRSSWISARGPHSSPREQQCERGPGRPAEKAGERVGSWAPGSMKNHLLAHLLPL